ncbi:tRNA (guanine(46)-N(7))-methyltransferase TrmB [Catenovulum sediminis]|uniref:tRNA (guanine(46)-N(7))-methyltransferase n=1 Tax=Catenovulum sediminis TaxID=1740262 RepID=A0ABV1RFA2_9ALTE
MIGNSRSIESSQQGIHKDLTKIVTRHLSSEFKKPVAEHTLLAYQKILSFIDKQGKPLIFDSCCGVGESSRQLAANNPDKCVVGVDKSEFRLNKQGREDHSNLLLIRADLNDLYRLMVKDKLVVAEHKIFYPNPWPKSQHIKRRWHGSPVFPQIAALSASLELRSNWLLYLQEFQIALQHLQINSQLNEIEVRIPITPFEEKYVKSGQKIYQLRT